jgi:hypothetical protein
MDFRIIHNLYGGIGLLTLSGIMKHCSVIIQVREEFAEGYTHSTLYIQVKRRARINRTKKYIERYVSQQKTYCSSIDIVVYH